MKPFRPLETLRRIRLPRIAELALTACVIGALTLIISELPQIEVVESAINDDNFSDLVLQTQGELPIDTNILVVTFDRRMFDEKDRVDREKLALGLAVLLQLEPDIVAVDVLLEDERPDSPTGDAMLAGLIADNPNLMFGIFYEDSLNRFRIPPPSFNLTPAQLGCVNLMPDEDRTIRTYTTAWGQGDTLYEAFGLKVARRMDSTALPDVTASDPETFIIDYAGSLGENTGTAVSPEGRHIFPNVPLDAIYAATMSGDEETLGAYRRMVAGKAVLVGYADLRNSQVIPLVDRFYTPLKPEENALPDMHGVGIHANVVNTILQRRIVRVMPAWANFIWGTLFVFTVLLSYEVIRRDPNPKRRITLLLGGFALMLVLGILLPVTAFRYTSFKFSIYSPVAGLLLARPALEIFDKLKRILRDMLRRRKLRRPLPEWIRRGMLDILQTPDIQERMLRAIHFVHRQFHAACALLFHESVRGELPPFPPRTVASPMMRRILPELESHRAGQTDLPASAEQARALIRTIAASQRLQETLRYYRSLYIAVNEVRRQNAALEDTVEGNETLRATAAEGEDYADLVLSALVRRGEEGTATFDGLYRAIEEFAERAADVLRMPDGTFADPYETDPIAAGTYAPFLLRRRCLLHDRDEVFIYFSEQEDANDRDDYFDIIYCGRSIRCRPSDHPSLESFREVYRSDNVPPLSGS